MQTITLFTIPQAFETEYDLMQWNAIKSWTLLNPKPDIFLLGNAPGVASIANGLGLYHIPNVYQNSSISEIAKWLDRIINNPILVYINPCMILTKDFTNAIQKIHNNQDHFFLTGQYRIIQTEGTIDFNNQWQHQLRVMADKQGMPQQQLQDIYLVFTKHLLKQLFVLDSRLEYTWEQQLFYAALRKYYPIIDGSPIITAFLQTPKSKWKVVDGVVIEGVPPDFELPPIVGENNDYTRALKRNGMDKEWEAYVPDPQKPRTTIFRRKDRKNIDVLPKHLSFQSTNMNNTIIQSLWIGNNLSKLEQLSIASFLYHGYEFHLYTYNDISGIPDGTQLKDANEIILEKDVFTYHNGSYAIFSDWFRWALLFKKGNFWVDADVICLKPFHFDTNIIFGLENVNRVGTAVLGFPSGHDLCRFLENNCREPNTFLPYDSKEVKENKLKRKLANRKKSDIGWGEAGGPIGFTQALKHFNLLHLAKPPPYFFPIHYANWKCVFDETLVHKTELFSNSFAIHLYNEMMGREKDFDKNTSFPELSLFEQLKKKYL